MGAARAEVFVVVDKSEQRMTVLVDGARAHSWPISTGRSGFVTPNGSYRPERLARRWFSRKYYNSPMPHSIFFYKGFAIHGSYEISRLGRPASHGCVRLHPRDAAALFDLVKEHGKDDTMIVVTGERPEPPVARAKPARKSASNRAARDRSANRYSRRVYRDMSVSANRYHSRQVYRGFRMPVADMPLWWRRM